MATVDNKRMSDGFLSLEAGVDAGRAPNLINKNASAWAINTTFRGGWPMPRPGWVKREMTFNGNGMVNEFLVNTPEIKVSANTTTNVFTATDHGLSDGDIVQVKNGILSQSSIPSPLALLTDYYVVNKTASTFKLEASIGGGAIDITTTGSNVYVVPVAANSFVFPGHNLSDGDIVQVKVSSNVGSVLPNPLVASTNYYVVNSSANEFRLETAVGVGFISFTTVGSGVLIVPANSAEITSGQAQTAFEETRFQCGDGYVDDTGNGSAISMQGGRVFKINISNFSVQEISITTNVGATLVPDYNSPNRELGWTCQAENYFLIQDGSSKPFIYTGATARRAGENEIPVGNQMTYYMGRIWVARGREYLAGDIVFGPSGTAMMNYRDSILKVTENTYLNEGGAFGVPVKSGEICALVPIANINTALGQGELLVFTQNNVFATLVPQDRTVWKNTTQPLQRVIQLSNGGFAQDSVVNVNEDLFYRSNDGIRSLAYSVRNSGQWGNVPISGEVTTILDADGQGLLKYGSGINFDNRMLMTVSPAYAKGHGIYHRALVALDFDLITGMNQKSPPAWEGIWTGLNILKLFTVYHMGEQRCFAYVLNDSSKIELWELTTNAQNDNDGTADIRIQWNIETRSMDFGSKFDAKLLFAGDMFIDRVSGQVDMDINYRPDSYPCWLPWDTRTECAKTTLCEDEITRCMVMPNLQPQYRPQWQFVQPADTFDAITNKLHRVGYEFQFRLNLTGFCRVKQFRANGYQVQEAPYGRQL